MRAERWAGVAAVSAGLVAAGCDALPRAVAQGAAAGEASQVTPVEGVEARRVWSGRAANFYVSDASPDGRLLTEVDWYTGDLAVIDLETGELRRVTSKGTWNDSQDFAEMSAFSPDGSHIAYSWYDAAVGGYAIRVIPVEGGAARVVLPADPSLGYRMVEDWAPDGTAVLFTEAGEDGRARLMEVALAGAAQRVVTEFGWRGPGSVEYSRDGRWIAMDVADESNPPKNVDVRLIARDGSREVALLPHPAVSDRLLGWSPDGGSVLVYSDRGGTPGIWQHPVRDGAPTGAPRLLRGGVWDLEPLGLSREALYYGLSVERPQVQVATMDFDAARVLVEPAPVQRPSRGPSVMGVWSPDGTRFAYLTRVPGGTNIVVRPADGGEGRELPLRLTAGAHPIFWAGDGAVLVFGKDERGRWGVYRTDLVTGRTTPVVVRRPDFYFNRFFTVSRDGGTLYLSVPLAQPDGPSRLVAYDIVNGAMREITRSGSPLSPAVSPDGRMLAVVTADAQARAHVLGVVPVAGGEVRELHRSIEPNALSTIATVAWSSPDRLVFGEYIADDPDSLRNHIRTLSLSDGGPVSVLRLPAGNGRHISVHPDGRRISFEGGRSLQEVWRLTGIPPSEAPPPR